MIYGSGDFVGLPWETVAKWFRYKIGPKKFSTVRHCADEFLEFLRKEINNKRNEKFRSCGQKI
ncbi:MAG TPA: hypothetical protein DEA55_05170, partial [Rhodospirillaceae bacterium]|nr:hypothetical protein [Rhodospirillaceae bacterium]